MNGKMIAIICQKASIMSDLFYSYPFIQEKGMREKTR